MTAPALFRQADIDRAVKAAIKTRGEVRMDLASGRIEVIPGAGPVATPARSYRGFVYAIRVRGFDMVKIGYSLDPSRRLRELQAGSGMAGGLEELLRLPGDRECEHVLHQHFEKYRLFGEWFRLEGSVLAWVNDPKAPI